MDSERVRKAEKIKNLYESKEWRQEDIARELCIPISAVRKVTKIYGYEHGKKKSTSKPNNLNEGQKIEPFFFEEELSFLDRYEI